MTRWLKGLGLVFAVQVVLGCSQQRSVNEIVTNAFADDQINGVVLVAEHGKIVLHEAHGYADGSQVDALTTQHRFQLGSIYKEFPGAAVMRLIEEGKVALSAPVSTYLDDYPTWASKVTVQQLFTYRSGLPLVPWTTLANRYGIISQDSLEKELRQLTEIAAEPGSDYIYSNYNPLLLMLIVEAVAQQSYPDFVRQAFLQPLAMKGAIFPASYPYENPELMALPFDASGTADETAYALPGMSLALSAEDLMKWLYGLYNFEVVTQSGLKKLSFQHGERSPLGQMTWSKNKINGHYHHGSSGNFEVALRYVPEQSRLIIVMTNRKQGNVGELVSEIAEASSI